VTDQTARLVPVDQPTALAVAIMEVLADRAGGAERAERARLDFVERFTIERSADRMVALYRRTVWSR
jgi:glycosyltransferase involved in cell wall biosynthesis